MTDNKKKEMEAMSACKKDDVLCRSWLIRFVNSQMLLKGCEAKGHLIMSAAKAEILSSIHMPVWKDHTLLSKSSWSGSLESMQYFATVIPESPDVEALTVTDRIMWLTKDKIEDQLQDTAMLNANPEAMPELVGSGQSAGGVVSNVVGSGAGDAEVAQLQRIVSRCKCEFYYVAYGEKPIDEVLAGDKIPRKPEESPWSTDKDRPLVNSFSLIHHDLNVCTNSLQYTMILDVLNNLLLYMEPTIKSRTENYLRMKYQLMLSKLEDQRKPILTLQSQIRQMACQLRGKEREIYAFQPSEDAAAMGAAEDELAKLESDVQGLKEEINLKSEELDVRLRCFHEFQMASNQTPHYGDNRSELLRRKSEIFFSRARWRLTEQDGQLGIGDVAISNFCYTKLNMRDDSAEHTFELGNVYVKNLLPGSLYTDIIYPTELKRDAPLDRHRTLRVFCREKAPVGGISVKAHFEINVVPLTINITQNFYKKIMDFCFPEKAIQDEAVSKEKIAAKKKSKKSSSFYVEMPLNQDDVEEMKSRAQRNKLFVYIKIPEVPLCVSYKGERDKKKILDVAGFLLQVPTIEYHNVTWTWLDLLLAVKSRVKDSLLSQAIKQKLSMKSHPMIAANKIGGGSTTTLNSISSDVYADDEEKAQLAAGDGSTQAQIRAGKKK